MDAVIQDAKQLLRQEIWDLLEGQYATEPGVHGHIPPFVGAEEAAAQLGTHPAWHDAQAIKVNPDRAQVPVRVRALQAGKTVYMAVPSLATGRPFYLLDPQELPVGPEEAALHQVAATFTPTVAVQQMPPIDVVVCGSVVVNPAGVRIGKGAGYSDIELALLAEAGPITPHTVIATTVHRSQLVNRLLPEGRHDFRVDVIATPGELVACPPHGRPEGIVWEDLTPERISSIPVLHGHPARPSGRNPW